MWLGESAPNPVLTTLKYFEDEYKEHVIQKRCPTGMSKLKTYVIDKEKCRGCGKCKRACPGSAIEGSVKQPHTIIPSALPEVRCVY